LAAAIKSDLKSPLILDKSSVFNLLFTLIGIALAYLNVW
jgi:hypothetical protein